MGFDRSYRGRRDALARCVAAALWAAPAGCDGGGGRAPRAVHPDCACYVIHERTGEMIGLSAEFARRGLAGLPTEARLMKALSDGVRGKPVPGLTVWAGGGSVAAAAEAAFEHAQLERGRCAGDFPSHPGIDPRRSDLMVLMCCAAWD